MSGVRAADVPVGAAGAPRLLQQHWYARVVRGTRLTAAHHHLALRGWRTRHRRTRTQVSYLIHISYLISTL